MQSSAFRRTLLSLEKGISKLEINQIEIIRDLNANPEVLAEAVQTVMRAEGVENAYEKLKELTRGKRISLDQYRAFVQTLKISADRKQALLALTPEKYIGLAAQIVNRFRQQ